jgi:aspartate/glutamate racemase
MSLIGKTLGIIHAAVFTANTADPYAKEILPGVEILHAGDDSIQRDNLAAPVGTIPKHNFYKFVSYAKFLEEAGCHLIMLACSTFNEAVAFAQPMITTPLLNIDRPMMDLALQHGKRIGLLGTLPSTMPASKRLLRQAAEEAGKSVEVHPVLCAPAFIALRAGDKEQHNRMLLKEIDKLSNKVDAIVLAQLSMSALETELTNTKVPVYNSGRTGFERARDMLMSMD